MAEAGSANKPIRRMLAALCGRLLLVIMAIALGLALVETLLRLQEPHFHLMGTRAESALDRYRAHAVWDHWPRPNVTRKLPSLHKLWPSPIIVAVNAQGCRHSRDLSRRPPQGTRRIIVLGDSFTEGYYQDTTFAAVLERRLNLRGDTVIYEAVNCGSSSYSPLLYYLRYKNQLSRYHPDELIVNVDLTDVYDDNHRYKPRARFDSSGEPLEARPGLHSWQRVADDLRYRFHFARLLLGNPKNDVIPTDDNILAYHTTLTPDSARWRTAVNVSLSYLQRLINLTHQQGVELTLTTYPYEPQYHSPTNGPQWHRGFEEEVRKLAARNGVRFWSAYDALRPFVLRDKLPIYWDNDFHFTPLGQNIWSNLFADYYIGARTRS